MKKASILFVLIFWAFAAAAQCRPMAEHVSVNRVGDSVRIAMRVEIPRRSAPSGVTLIHAPLITDGTWKVSLPSIVVQGRQASISWRRHDWAAGAVRLGRKTYYTKNGGIVDYDATVPFQHWMRNGRLEMETVAAGCAESRVENTVLEELVLPFASGPEPEPEREPPVEPVPPPDTGEILAKTFTFVLPASDFDPDEPVRFHDDERDNALTIYYRINDYDIDPDYADNGQTLVNLLAAIDVIEKSGDVHIEKVVVAGFASPEGPFALNDRLAWERAVSIKEYIMRHCSMPDRDIVIFNGSLDWRGLRRLVVADSRVPLQKEVLDLIDRRHGPESAAQGDPMNPIRALGDGGTWAYLAENILPRLRNGAFIRVYFDR